MLNKPLKTFSLKTHHWKLNEKLFFYKHQQPCISIIIPTYNNTLTAMNCLNQLHANTNLDIGFEIIIADDNSSEDISTISTYTENIRIIKQPKKVGFIENCNLAALHAAKSSQYLVFLNANILVQKGWLYWLLKGFEVIHPSGIVCPLSLYPDGTIESAGNILHKDGSTFCYGRHDTDIENSDYQYVREIDCASTSCLMIKTELWKKLNGFDEIFSPESFEDTDLCLRARQLGYKVIYQPCAMIINHELQNYSEQKNALIQQNKQIFLQRWEKTLNKEATPVFSHKIKNQCAQSFYFHYRDRNSLSGNRVCILLNTSPTLDICYLKTQLEFMRENSLISLVIIKGHLKDKEILVLQQKGIHVVHNKKIIDWLHDFVQYFDTLYVPLYIQSEIFNKIKELKKEQARLCRFEPESTFCSTLYDIALAALAKKNFTLKFRDTPAICSWYFPIISSTRVILQLIQGYITLRLSLHKNTNYYALVTRKDIFPILEGASVKINNTARQLSLQQGKTIIITSSADTYWLYNNGVGQEITYPYGLIHLTELFLKRNKKILPEKKVFLEDEFWLNEYPKYDLAFQLRVFYLSCRYKIRIFQAEFFGFENALTLVKKYLPTARSLISQHNIESSRISEITNCTEEQVIAMRAFEVETCNKSNGVIVVSQEDKQKLLQAGIIKVPIHILPLGVDLDVFSSLPLNCKENTRKAYGIPLKAKVVFFHGLLDYPPNKEAVKILIEDIYPKLQDALSESTWLLIAGKNPPATEHANKKQIIFTGAVDSIAETIVAADIAIVALQAGGGMRLKILEYFAARIPVIATIKGAEGLAVTDGKEILLRESPEEIASTAAALLKNQQQQKAISTAAYEFVKTFDWKEIVKKNARLLQAISMK